MRQAVQSNITDAVDWQALGRRAAELEAQLERDLTLTEAKLERLNEEYAALYNAIADTRSRSLLGMRVKAGRLAYARLGAVAEHPDDDGAGMAMAVSLMRDLLAPTE